MAQWIIGGLGNPGEKYKGTRHNAGFMALDKIAESFECGAWRLDKKSNSLLAKCVTPGVTQGVTQPILLAKPQTFMNNSGKAVKAIVSRFKLHASRSMVVVHDDIDIPFGEVRAAQNRGSAGHKGVGSVIKELGTQNFTRVRIGILPDTGKPKDPENFVLKKFTKEEQGALPEILQQASSALTSILTGNPAP